MCRCVMAKDKLEVHEEGLVALAGMSASPDLQKATGGALSAGISIFTILETIYAHKDDVIAAYTAIMALWNSIKPATPTPAAQ